MELIFVCAVLGCIPAAIAKSKGRGFFGWWIYGALLFIVALIHSLVIKKDIRAIERSQIDEGMVKCPYCAEMIKPEAIKCKHCGSDVREALDEARIASFKPSDMPFDAFFIRRKEGFDVNDEAIGKLVSGLKKANPDSQPINIKDKYKAQIDDLVNQMPSGVRSEFLRKYESLL